MVCCAKDGATVSHHPGVIAIHGGDCVDVSKTLLKLRIPSNSPVFGLIDSASADSLDRVIIRG